MEPFGFIFLFFVHSLARLPFGVAFFSVWKSPGFNGFEPVGWPSPWQDFNRFHRGRFAAGTN